MLGGLCGNATLLADRSSSGSSLRSMLRRDSETVNRCDLKRIVDVGLSMSSVSADSERST